MNPSLYDPRFFLNLFAQICSAESYVDKHLVNKKKLAII